MAARFKSTGSQSDGNMILTGIQNQISNLLGRARMNESRLTALEVAAAYITNGDGIANAPVTANYGYFQKITTGFSLSATKISCYLLTGIAGTIEMGLYDSAGAKLQSATVSSSTAGQKEVTISQSLTPGIYWLAFAANAAVDVFYSRPVQLPLTLYGGVGSQYPLPANIPGAPYETTTIPLMAIY